MEEFAVPPERIEQAYQQRSKDSFLTFVRGLKIPHPKGITLFDECMADYQRACFADLAPSLEAVQKGILPPIRKFWIERTKKGGKDSDLGVCLTWLIAFSRIPRYYQVGAADRDQAAIVKQRIETLLHYNEWLQDYIEIQNWKIRSKNSLALCDIMAADIGGAHGGTPDVLIVNELTHVTKWEFIENLLDNADGVPLGMVLIATNAGFKGTTAEVLRNNAIESDKWSAHIWDRPAPWLNAGDIEDAKKRNPKGRFNRLWRGVWSSGKGDALDEDDVERCFEHNVKIANGPLLGWRYLAGLDLGVANDHAAFVVVGVNMSESRIRVFWHKAWVPDKSTGEVDLISVEDTVRAASRTFRCEWVGYDPWQAKLMAQRLYRGGVPVRELSFSTPKNLTEMAETLISVVEAGMLECYDDHEGRFRRDFGKFTIAERQHGYKLEAVSDMNGHADVGTALVICLPKAVSMLDTAGRLLPTDTIAEVDDYEMTQNDIEELPPELREIYSAYDDEADESRQSKIFDGFDDY